MLTHALHGTGAPAISCKITKRPRQGKQKLSPGNPPLRKESQREQLPPCHICIRNGPIFCRNLGEQISSIELDTPTVTEVQLQEIERVVNEKILQQVPVVPKLFADKEDPTLSQAREMSCFFSDDSCNRNRFKAEH
jgi:hypothetical protein